MPKKENYFIIELNTTSKEFIDDGMAVQELGRQIKEISLKVSHFGSSSDYCFNIRDRDGNKIGELTRCDFSTKPEFIGASLGRFDLLIHCENAAFFDDLERPSNDEISRILMNTINDIEGASTRNSDGKLEGVALHDIHGSAVGQVRWSDTIPPKLEVNTSKMIASAENNLGNYIDLSEVFEFKSETINEFFEAHSVHLNPMPIMGRTETYLVSDIALELGEYFNLDLNELTVALLTFEHQGKPESLQVISKQITDAVLKEATMFGYENEQVEILEAIQAFESSLTASNELVNRNELGV